jgi:NAD(P)-dependent dehydrogenase (short-subunit alcohol dehydrogenase family)
MSADGTARHYDCPVNTALISGGTGGLGLAVTRSFLQSGWRCVVPYSKPASAQRLTEFFSDTQTLERLHLIQADLFEQAAVTDLVSQADVPTAPLAALVNLLGGFDAPGPVHEVPLERFGKQLELNLRATYLLCAAALPGMLDRADGAIICVSSRAALRPFPGAAGYVTSKAAVLAFVDALASEYTAAGVRINAILPSIIDTPSNRAAQPASDYSNWVKPEEIAPLISFLCSPGARAISGAHIPIYGRA